MRYRYIAILAIVVMLVGVMGIYKKGADDKQPIIDERIESVYFVAQKDMQRGEIPEGDFYARKTIKFNPGQRPDELAEALDEKKMDVLLSEGAIAETEISAGQVLTLENLKNLPEKIDSELIAFPLSVSAESILNPKVADYGFVDLYLISNDNKIYREDFYQKRGGSTGKDYKDTRVKKFASNVWIVKNAKDRAGKEKKSSLLDISKGDTIDRSSSKLDKSGNAPDTRIVYAYFNKDDIDSVIQAQVLGMFFVSPVTVTMLNKPLASISVDSREITAADIVSGAPLAEKKIKVIEIRGAKSSNGRN